MRKKKHTANLKKRQSYLIVTEGAEDEAFFKHLRNYYQPRYISIRTSNSAGGYPSSPVIKASKMNSANQFTKCIVLIDSDRNTETEAAQILADSKGISVVLSDHCLEAELLRIASVSFKQGEPAKRLKNSLAELLSGSSTVSKSYERTYSEPMLSQARVSSIWLNTLITICEGSF